MIPHALCSAASSAQITPYIEVALERDGRLMREQFLNMAMKSIASSLSSE